MKTTIGIVDDHKLFQKALTNLIETFPDFKVTLEALNGLELQKMLKMGCPIPDIMLIDVNMPKMDGEQTVIWLKSKYPEIKKVALSANDDDHTIIKMLNAGCCAYLLKDIDPNDFEFALTEINLKGFFNSDLTNINYRRLLRNNVEAIFRLSNQEKDFLNFAKTDLTYKEIAIKLNSSERSVDRCREILFQKFKVQSRVGLVIEALKSGIISL